MIYFFILGQNKNLSIAEIAMRLYNKPDEQSTYKNTALKICNDAVILESKTKIDINKMMNDLGGTPKIGEIFTKIPLNNKEEIAKMIISEFQSIADAKKNDGKKSKFIFGISAYENSINTKNLAQEIKNKFINSCRWILGDGKILSGASIKNNKIIAKGAEIVIFSDKNYFYLGKTLVIQPFQDLSNRDYGRPARNARSGMLPPKLAKIMINFASQDKEKTFLDPFCGSGTILSEALLLGYKNLTGTDLNDKAILNTQKNLDWLLEKYSIDSPKIKLFKQNALTISRALKSINTVITEPYLGPQRGKIDLKKTIPELKKLYGGFLNECLKILKPSGKIVMIWPIFTNEQSKKIAMMPTNISNGFKIINPIPAKLLKYADKSKLTDRGTIIYGRPGQKILREIVVLEKK